MPRLTAIALLLTAPIVGATLLPSPVAAQDCLCVDAAGFGVMEVETPDTTIASTVDHSTDPGTAGDIAPRGSHRTVLWCASANDPRCMPMQPSDAPTPRALSGGTVATLVDAVRRGGRRFATELVCSPGLGLAPALGVTASLDRPPRG